MKIFFKYFFLLICILGCGQLFAQVAINTTGAPPNTNAMLDISSSSKGILIPRLSSAGRMSITSPKTGLMVFDSTTASFWFYQSNAWRELSTGSSSSDSALVYGQQTGVINSYNIGGPAATYTDSSGYLYDSGGPTGNYSNNEKDTVVIGSTDLNNVAVRIQILSSNIENIYDSLIIIDAFNHTYVYTGIQTGTLVLPFGARVIFKSNNMITAPGFKIRWDLMMRPINAPDFPPATGWYYIPQNVAIKGGVNVANYWSKDSTGLLSFDWGENNLVKGLGSAAIGLNNTIPAKFAFTGGLSNTITGDYGAALNNNNNVSGIGAFAANLSNNSSGYSSFAAGNYTKASGDYSASFGQNNYAGGRGSAVFGSQDSAVNNGDFAVGGSTLARGGDSFAGGYFSAAGGYCSFGFGEGAYAAGSRSMAVNLNTYALGKASFSTGAGTEADGENALSAGNYSYAVGKTSIATGYSTESDGENSISGGYYTNAIGKQSVALGNQTKASAQNSAAFGLLTVTKAANAVTLGMYNDSILTSTVNTVTPTTPLFLIGNGDAVTTRSNAMVVLKNGNTGLGNIIPQQNLSVNAGMNIDQASANTGTISNTLTFGGASGEGIGSKRTAGGNGGGLDFYTANTPRMLITNAGGVGIGNILPQQNLSVNLGMNIDQASANTGTIANTLTFGGSSGEGIGSKRTTTGNQNGLDLYTAGTARVSVTNTGKVGIGTTNPGAKLQINQAGNYANSESADHALEIWDNAETLYMGADEANDISYIQAVGNNFLHTLALNPRTGNVAIGKPTATAPLDVNGDIKTSGNITVQTDRGIVRNSGTTQLKIVVTGAVFTGTSMAAFATNSASLTFSQAFTAPPVVYVANVLQDGANSLGSTDKVLISFTNVTNTGCIVSIRNTHNAAITFDGNWQIVAMGAQ